MTLDEVEKVDQDAPLYQVHLYMKSGNVIELFNLLKFKFEQTGRGKPFHGSFTRTTTRST
jgi:hypothetical protein